MAVVVVERADAAAVRPLRRAVLRPHQPPEAVEFPGDAVPGALHVVARLAAPEGPDALAGREGPARPAGPPRRDGPGGAVVGVGTIAPEPHPRDPAPGDFRVRGMATAPGARGRGVGAAVLEALVAHAAASGGRRAWCNARTPAVPFYERAGWAVEGDEFDLPPIGPHFLMSRRL